MAVCSNCQAIGPRVRSRWNEKGFQLPDECPACAPETFEKFTAPSDKKIWMGYEAHPNEYVHSEDGGYDRKPEYVAEQEAKLCAETEDEKVLRLGAEAKKRATRRTEPMTPVELDHALKKASQISDLMQTTGEA
jgi:hypothetical protein